MKKVALFAIVAAMTSVIANASDYYETSVDNCNPAAMRAELDRATYENRAVVTVVTCRQNNNNYYDTYTQETPNMNQSADNNEMRIRRTACVDCFAPVERVVDRRYYVEETVQKYEPVVTYMPAGTYKRVKTVCPSCAM